MRQSLEPSLWQKDRCGKPQTTSSWKNTAWLKEFKADWFLAFRKSTSRNDKKKQMIVPMILIRCVLRLINVQKIHTCCLWGQTSFPHNLLNWGTSCTVCRKPTSMHHSSILPNGTISIRAVVNWAMKFGTSSIGRNSRVSKETLLIDQVYC